MPSESFLQELKYYCDIEQILSSYVRLTRKGKMLTGLCPFHNEKTPSFTVYPESQSYYCFGCGAGGDVITFIRQAENLEYVEALRLLCQRAGLRMPDEEQDDGAARLKMRILEINRASARFFHDTLLSQAGVRGLTYFQGRALSPGIIKRFGLGYAPAGWDVLEHHLAEKGFSRQEMLEARVVSPRKNGEGCFDMFRDRVMFPIIDLRGNVIGFGGRLLEGEGPKYLNSPDTPVFKKSRNLFALNRAKAAKEPGLILAEGYMDVIALHQAGFVNAVATLGTSLTREQTQLIARYSTQVIVAYDADGAGQAATRRAMALFDEAGVKVRVLKLEGVKDPDEFIKTFGATRFRMLLDNCRSAIEFEIFGLRSQYDVETAEGKVGFLGEFAKLMAGVRNPIERDVYVKKTAQELDVSPQAVMQMVGVIDKRRLRGQEKKQQRDLKMYVGAGAKGRSNPEREHFLKYALAEERLMTLLLKNPDYYEYITSRIAPDQFVTNYNRGIFQKLCQRLQSRLSVDMMSLSAVMEPEEMGFLSGLLAGELQEKHPLHEADDYIKTILQKQHDKSTGEVAAMNEEELRDYFRAIAAAKNRGK